MKSLWYILLAAVIAGVVSVLAFDTNLHSEIRYFRTAAEYSDAWEAKLRERGEPCYIFAGGSEVRIGIDPEVMLKEGGVPVVNAGIHAGFGMACNASCALRYAKPGDTLVLSLISFQDLHILPRITGMKFLSQRYTPEIAECGLIAPSYRNLSMVVLGDYDYWSHFWYYAIRKDHWVYAYDLRAEMHSSGWMQVNANYMSRRRCPAYSLRVVNHLSDDDEVVRLLDKLSTWCRQHDVRLIAHLPVVCTSVHKRVQNAVYALQLTQRGIPVLKDGRLGVLSDTSCFSDNTLHLSPQGAKDNSLWIARLLKGNHLWSEPELVSYLKRWQRNPDGSPVSQTKAGQP